MLDVCRPSLRVAVYADAVAQGAAVGKTDAVTAMKVASLAGRAGREVWDWGRFELELKRLGLLASEPLARGV